MAAGPKGVKAVAKSKKAGELASSGKSRKAADKGDPFVHHEDITPEEFQAFRQYQSAYYHDINAHLRQTDFAHLAEAHAVAEIPHLHSVMAKQSLARDTILYRGVSATGKFDPTQFRAGDVYSDKAFMSTSLKKSAAMGFVDETGSTAGALFHIKAPKGTRALPGYKVGTGSSFQASEREVLLGAGSSVKIHKVTKSKSGVFHIHGTLQ
jgi:hypothetical protein